MWIWGGRVEEEVRLMRDVGSRITLVTGGLGEVKVHPSLWPGHMVDWDPWAGV